MVKIENQYVKIYIEDGIVKQTIKPDTVLNLDSSKVVVKDRKKVSNGKVMPFLVDMTQLVSIDMPSRIYLGNEESTEFLSCGAFLINSNLNKLLINIFIRLSKPSIPTRFFTNKEKAIQWLKETHELHMHVNEYVN